jgi:hypothetical protein
MCHCSRPSRRASSGSRSGGETPFQESGRQERPPHAEGRFFVRPSIVGEKSSGAEADPRSSGRAVGLGDFSRARTASQSPCDQMRLSPHGNLALGAGAREYPRLSTILRLAEAGCACGGTHTRRGSGHAADTAQGRGTTIKPRPMTGSGTSRDLPATPLKCLGEARAESPLASVRPVDKPFH